MFILLIYWRIWVPLHLSRMATTVLMQT